jgi:hypothetical protein
MSDAPDETQRFYRAAALRIFDEMKHDSGDTTEPEYREALLYLAEALVDLAESMTEEAPAGGRRN